MSASEIQRHEIRSERSDVKRDALVPRGYLCLPKLNSEDFRQAATVDRKAGAGDVAAGVAGKEESGAD